MKLALPNHTFPVLTKELVERAARKRTYAIRIVYALLFISVGVVYVRSNLGVFTGYRWDYSTMLGKGRELFIFMVVAQAFGIAVFLPAMVSGAFTTEKERGTLSMLLVTDLRPSEIVLQKYLSGLVPMVSIILLGMPVLAFAYTLGGMTMAELISAMVALLLACLQVGAIGVLMSALLTSTVAAFVCTYAAVAVLFLAAVGVEALFSAIGSTLLDPAAEALCGMLCPAALVTRGSGNAQSVQHMAATIAFSLTGTLGLLIGARAALTRRAHAPSGNMLKQLWEPVDDFMLWLNDEYARGTFVGSEAPPPPKDRPIAWRETTRRSLGTPRYLVRLLLILELPVAIGCAIVLHRHLTGAVYNPDQSEGLTFLTLTLWAIASIIIASVSVNAVISERATNTLDSLLVTPLAGRDILTQKLAAATRLRTLFAVPFVTIFLTELACEETPVWDLGGLGGIACYALFSILFILIYLPAFAWVALWIGLRCKTRLRALLLTVGSIVAWNILPLLVLHLALEFRYGPLKILLDILLALCHAVCPILAVLIIETGEHPIRGFYYISPVLVILNVMVVFYILWNLRGKCLNEADRLLGRIPESPWEVEPDPHPAKREGIVAQWRLWKSKISG